MQRSFQDLDRHLFFNKHIQSSIVQQTHKLLKDTFPLLKNAPFSGKSKKRKPKLWMNSTNDVRSFARDTNSSHALYNKLWIKCEKIRGVGGRGGYSIKKIQGFFFSLTLFLCFFFIYSKPQGRELKSIAPCVHVPFISFKYNGREYRIGSVKKKKLRWHWT